MNPTKEEIKEWRENPVTKNMIVQIDHVRGELLSSAIIDRENRNSICDRVAGMGEVRELILNYEGEG